MDSVMDLLDVLEDTIESSRAIPFSSKVAIDKNEMFDIIKDIRIFLPNEIKQSKWVMEERDKILADAQKEAEEIIKDAEHKIMKMVDETEIYKRAKQESEELIESSKQTSREMRLGAMEYADGILEQLQNKMQETFDEFKVQSNVIEGFYTQLTDMIYKNRQELREPAKAKEPTT